MTKYKIIVIIESQLIEVGLSSSKRVGNLETGKRGEGFETLIAWKKRRVQDLEQLSKVKQQSREFGQQSINWIL